jgi:hypothetical protein
MAGGEQPDAAKPRQRVRREHQDEAEGQHQRRQRDRELIEHADERAEPPALGVEERVGERQSNRQAGGAGDRDDRQARGKGAAEARVPGDVDVPLGRRSGRQQVFSHSSPNEPNSSSAIGTTR